VHKTLVFYHIPKTAGTTWRSILYKQYGEGEVCPIYNNHDYYYSLAAYKKHTPERKIGYKALMGHFGLEILKSLPKSSKPLQATFLRHPQDRCLSFYNHLLNHQRKGESLSISDFLLAKEVGFDNHQVRVLSGGAGFGKISESDLQKAKNWIDQSAFVGLTDLFQESYALAVIQLGWHVTPYASRNFGIGKPVQALTNVTEQDLILLAKHNTYDEKLYQYSRQVVLHRIEAMQRVFSNRWSELLDDIKAASQQRPFYRSTGRITLANLQNIKGWAKIEQYDEPARIIIKKNGVVIAKVLANEFRSVLANRGLEPGGRCGFSYQFSTEEILQPVDLLEIEVTETGQKFTINR